MPLLLVFFVCRLSFDIIVKYILLKEIESRLISIQKEFKTAIAEKTKLEFETEKTALTINLAHRLVNGLGTEAIRLVTAEQSPSLNN